MADVEGSAAEQIRTTFAAQLDRQTQLVR